MVVLCVVLSCALFFLSLSVICVFKFLSCVFFVYLCAVIHCGAFLCLDFS